MQSSGEGVGSPVLENRQGQEKFEHRESYDFAFQETCPIIYPGRRDLWQVSIFNSNFMERGEEKKKRVEKPITECLTRWRKPSISTLIYCRWLKMMIGEIGENVTESPDNILRLF